MKVTKTELCYTDFLIVGQIRVQMRQWQLAAATSLHELLAMSVVPLGRAPTPERAVGNVVIIIFIEELEFHKSREIQYTLLLTAKNCIRLCRPYVTKRNKYVS
jgi:hypothetical protein